MEAKHPVQPIERDEYGVDRFKRNAIVGFLLEHGTRTGCGMNDLAMLPFSQEDRQQFAQLIGYSVSGYSSLSYVDEAWARVDVKDQEP